MSSNSSDDDSSSSSSSSTSSSSSSHHSSSSFLPVDNDNEDQQLIPGPLVQRQNSTGYMPINVKYTRRWDESRSAYFRRLDCQGNAFVKRQRKKRRIIREHLGDNHADLLAAVESSSEEEDEYCDSDGQLDDTIDWHDLSEKHWWGSETLFSSIPVREISSLVGWATHQTQSGEKATTPLDEDVFHNPLFSLPNVPPRPSFLKFLSRRAGENIYNRTQQKLLNDKMIPNSNRQQLSRHGDTATCSRVRKNEGQPKKRQRFKTQWFNHKRLAWQTWTQNSGDSNYQFLKKVQESKQKERGPQARPFNNMPEIQTSEPPDVLKSPISQLVQSFDQTALVALSVVLEEAVTASLLPLAHLHANRCRELEQEHNLQRNQEFSPKYTCEDASDRQSVNPIEDSTEKSTNAGKSDANKVIVTKENPFDEWTLPPSEAIMKVIGCLHQPTEEQVCLPSTLPATRVSSVEYGHINPKDTMLDKLPSFGNFTCSQRQEKCFLNWCKSRGLNPSFVRDNMDVYGVFFQSSHG